MDSVNDPMQKGRIRQSHEFQFFAGWGYHIFFQTNDGVLWACGENSKGQLSLGTKEVVSVVFSPVKVAFFTPGSKKEIIGVSIGGYHSLFLTLHLGAFSSGNNLGGRLSDSTTEDRYLAVPVVLEDESAQIRSVVAGLDCSFLLTVEGEVFSAGMNSCGQLGHGDKENVSIGKKISSLIAIVQIVTGESWAIFRSEKSNALFVCGYNYGQFGFGDADDKHLVPVEIPFFKERNIKIEFLIGGFTTAYFVTSDNQVYCSGYGDEGEFGNGENENSLVPVLSRPLSDFQIFFSGCNSGFVVLKKNDRIYGCGKYSGSYGYSNPETDTFSNLVEIENLRGKNVKQIATRDCGTYAICGDGSIYAAGDEGGDCGMMMNGKKEDSKKFILVGKYNLKRAAIPCRRNREKQERVIFLMSSIPIVHVLCSFIANQPY